MWYVYILKCRDDSLYTGITNNPPHRLQAHNAGLGAKYTRSRRPVELVYLTAVENHSAALKLESEIKHLPRSSKLALIVASAVKDQIDTEEHVHA